MSGGINQLVDTYKGNPQPLLENVKKAQQGQQPGEIPADLEEALALQEIAKLRQGAQNQQAMQAGGAQQSVVDKLKQILAGNQAQAQMAQREPVMAARGGSIDQLMSNLGRHYAGGGIIAFNGKDSSQLVQDIAEIPQAFDDMKQRAREEDARRAEQDRRMEQYKQEKLAAQQKTSLFNYIFGSPEREKEGQAKLAELSNAPLPKTSVGDLPAPTDPEVEKLKRLAATRSQTGVSTNPALKPVASAPRPSANTAPSAPSAPSAPAAPAAEKLNPESLRGLLENYIRPELKLSPEDERKKAVEFTKQTMGLDALLNEKERRANEREALIERAKGERMPAWVEALSAAGKPVRGGLGSLLGQMGNAAQNTRESYAAQDLAYQKELAQLRDVITNAKIDGNKELVKQGMAAYKEVNDRRNAAATNATSLVRTDEMTEQRKAEAAARLAALAGRGAGAGDKQQLAELKALQTSKTNQLKTAYGSDKKRLQNELAIIEAEIAKMAGISTMATAPGAGSPGGTRPPLSSFQR